MWKIYHLPGWLMLKLLWPLFSNNHLWKIRRGYTNYECYSLSEWCEFINDVMRPPERFMQNYVIDGFFWVIMLFFIVSMLFLQTAKAEPLDYFVERAGYKVSLDHECTIKADFDIHIRIFEKRWKYNTWDYFLWEGDLKKWEQITIKTHSGRIRYTYSRNGSDRDYGDNRATCQNNLVHVP